MELIDKLGLDLNMFIAQIISFVILFVVLNTLLYKPIFNLLDKRKKMIEKSVEDAKKAEEQLNSIADEKSDILSKASKEAVSIIENSKSEGEKEHLLLIERAKKEIDELTLKHKILLEEEKKKMLIEAKKEISDLIIIGAEKILMREFSESDQKRLTDAINSELKTLNLN